MSVREFEGFHGIVLTKLVRSDRPITLRMIETKPAEAWSAYTLNDEVDLFIKHSSHPRAFSQKGGGHSWTFVFSRTQLKQMQKSSDNRKVFAALVCGSQDVSDKHRAVCLLEPDEVKTLLDLSCTDPQSVTVRLQPRKQLRILKDRTEVLLVPQNSLETWVVPGS